MTDPNQQYPYRLPDLDLEQSLWLEDNDPHSYYNSSWINQNWNQPPPTPQASSLTPPTIIGAFGRVGSTPTQTAENMSPSPPPPLQWSSCSMFMVATDHWTNGHNDRIDTTGEQQLNTPEPVDIRGFDYDGSLGGLGPANDPRNANSKNHIKNSSITTMNGEERNSIIGHGNKREQPFEFKLIPATSPSAPWAMSDFSTSWQFERCPEETVLSPEMSYLSPQQSPSGMPSPDTSSGVGSEADEFETSVDFNKNVEMFSVDDANDYTTSLTDEIEQLSESFYCKAEDLISIENPTIVGTVAVPPFFLKVLQEEESNASDGTPSLTVSNGTVYDTRPSIVTKFLSDADKEDEDFELEKAEYDVAEATAITPATLQSVSSDTLDLKTQTQLEHNYTIKLPLLEAGNPGYILSTNNTLVKEHSWKPRDTVAILPPLQQTPKRTQPPGIKRQLFQRKMRTEMAVENKLKLKIPTPSAPIVAPVGILNTPDLTNQVLELEAEAEILSAEDQFDLLTYISSGTDYDVVPLSPVEEKPSVPKEEPTVQSESTICPDTLSKLLSNPPTKRKLPIITLDNLEELTSSTTPKKFRSATSSTASSVCGDSVSEASSSAKKRRGRPPKQSCLHSDPAEYQHLNEEDLRYREQRDKNNEASRKSRINRRDRELKLEHEANALHQQHRELENEEQKLIRDCARWRRAVMRLALL